MEHSNKETQLMKKHVRLFVIIATILIVPMIPQTQALETTSQTITSTGTIINTNTRTMEVGLNYLSTYHLYSPKYTTDEILERDFSKFQQDGISVISLSLYWYRLEGNTKGSYNGTLPDGSIYGDAFLANIKHVITTANQYGIKVIATLHTLWGNDSTWCTPDYVIDPVSGRNIGLAVVRSPEMRQAFIDMVNHTVSYLAGSQGIWAWAILNEPWYWGRTMDEHDFITNSGQTQKDNFLTLFQELSNIVKTQDYEKQVTIRFCNTKEYIGTQGTPQIKNLFTDDWEMDIRLLNSIDFISFNVYPPNYPELDATWKSITTANVLNSTKTKQTWITEFGYCATNDQAQQANAYQAILTFFKTLPVKGCLAWQWTDSIAQDANLNSSANICPFYQTQDGTSAYGELCQVI